MLKGNPTNRTIAIMMIVCIAITLTVLAVVLWGPKTILLEKDSTGNYMVGSMKQHLPGLPKSSETLEENEDEETE